MRMNSRLKTLKWLAAFGACALNCQHPNSGICELRVRANRRNDSV
jgi:hypothetical protein